MLAHHRSELICDLAEYYNILDYRRVPGRLLGTLAVGLRAESRIGMIREGIKADPTTVMIVKIYDVLMQVFGDKKQKPMIEHFIIKQNTGDNVTFKSGRDFDMAWEMIRGKKQ